jgi:hypothetical protein
MFFQVPICLIKICVTFVFLEYIKKIGLFNNNLTEFSNRSPLQFGMQESQPKPLAFN